MNPNGVLQYLLLFIAFRIGSGSRPNAFLGVYSDCFDSEHTVTENHVKTLYINYTLNQPVWQNENTTLSICARATHPDTAVVSFSNNSCPTFKLQTQTTAQLNFTVKGLFVGKTYIQLRFVLSQVLNASCETEIKEIVKQSPDNYGFNLTNIFQSDQQTTIYLQLNDKLCEMGVVREGKPIETAFQVVVILLVILINLGLGCKTDLSVVKKVLLRPIAPVTGVCSQFIVMPLVSFAAVRVFQFRPALALGFFTVGCSPGGSASNAYTLLLNGDLSLSVTMTFISTIAALGMLPLWLFSLGEQVNSEASIKIPFQNIFYSLMSLVIPIGIGLVIKYKRPKWAEMFISASKVLMVLFLIFILTVGIYAYQYVFRLITVQVILTAAVIPSIGFALGSLIAFICRLPRPQILTIAIETGIQNTGIAVLILLLSLKSPDSDISIIAPIVFSLFTPLPLWVVIAVMYIRRYCFQTHKSLPQEDQDRKELSAFHMSENGNNDAIKESENK